MRLTSLQRWILREVARHPGGIYEGWRFPTQVRTDEARITYGSRRSMAKAVRRLLAAKLLEQLQPGNKGPRLRVTLSAVHRLDLKVGDQRETKREVAMWRTRAARVQPETKEFEARS